MVSVADPPPVTVLGANPPVAPAGSPLSVRATLPPNPFTAVTVTLYDVPPPAVTDWLAGVAATVKSLTERVTLAVRVTVPLVPVMVNG